MPAQLLQAVDMDLPDLVRAAEDACGRAIDTDPGFVSLAAALHHLALLDRYAVFRGMRRDVLLDFADAVNALDGSYITAEDVGTSTRMRSSARRTTGAIALRTANGTCVDVHTVSPPPMGSGAARTPRVSSGMPATRG